ncbi:unnamed protein product [Dicrocoelium dendriticum]|nr:unnamed protein product [Dicrocoelium dendriticum]
MLATAMCNTFSTCNRNVAGTDLNLLALMHTLKPETQQLCCALAEHIGSATADSNPSTPVGRQTSPTSPSQLVSQTVAVSAATATTAVSQFPFNPSVNSIMNRSLPTTLQLAETRPPIDLFVPSPVLPFHPTNFAMTAAIINALSANSTAVGMHLLPACSPLLQLAIRQALSECLSSLGPLTIQGDLEICVGSGRNPTQSTHSLTVLRFNDYVRNRRPSQCIDSHLNVTANSVGSTDTHPAVQGGGESWDAAYTDTASQVNSGSSRRKSLNPSKCSLGEDSRCSASNHLNPTPSPTVLVDPTIRPHSGPTSPSTDSGVLDLSHNGSLAGSAPITPLKGLGVHSEPDQRILEAYQKQLSAFGRLQAVWSKASIAYGSCRDMEFTPLNAISTTSIPSSYPVSICGPLSAPSSPAKVQCRDRGPGRPEHCGRACTLRRPNSNRRFPCNQCREEFPSLHTLEEHTMFRHGAYRCHICRAKFTQRSNLQRHALKHVGFKPFECRVCCKAYYRKDHLMRHMEMSHPGHAPRENITVHLTSSESLEFLNRSFPARTVADSASNGSVYESGEDTRMDLGNLRHPDDEDIIHRANSAPSTSGSSPYREELFPDNSHSHLKESEFNLRVVPDAATSPRQATTPVQPMENRHISTTTDETQKMEVDANESTEFYGTI